MSPRLASTSTRACAEWWPVWLVGCATQRTETGRALYISGSAAGVWEADRAPSTRDVASGELGTASWACG
jgi:hypothetical protein